MKFAKLFLSVLFFLTVLTTNLSPASAQSPSQKSKKDFLTQAVSNYIEYIEIDGIIWVIVYNNEGKETERYPLE
ncbi:MAG: hypothetical protein KBG21_01500 [Ignavibacteria bacterium]|jgi:hypothetical protein|nr:hypothetical protein [Ignavibacteria bacterium]